MPLPALLRRVSGPLSCCWMLFVCCLGVLPARAADEPRLSARSAILLDAGTGEILYERDPHAALPPASTTKVLTALIALERLDPAARLPVSPMAALAAPSRVGLHPGDRVSAEDALHGLLLKSGNDAAEVL
ncbi:MAG TPA: D-alanyl-D-alanine carboxypeptidase, partial [Plasticicumulans sp.]|nr:D-alanyl-D-alanine carboxypeptidase [Plasticicumulans sp.]